MGGPHYCSKVGGAHGVLQTTSCCSDAASQQWFFMECGDNKQDGVSHQGQTVERLATKVHLVLIDEDAAEEGSEEEGDEDQDCPVQVLEVHSSLVHALDMHADRSGIPSHVRDIGAPTTVGHHIHNASTGSQGPAEDQDPSAWTFEAVPGCRGLPVRFGAYGKGPTQASLSTQDFERGCELAGALALGLSPILTFVVGGGVVQGC
mmetsp:Transcript_53044/g.113282  ORF Transcript_53044/g.113282 Transcript_53044/m.113282 type:complete len:205 (+) Transcript_53044:759-1373(+)